MMSTQKFSGLAIIGAILVTLAMGLAAILLIGDGDAATQRLALFFGMLGIVVPAFIAMIRADQSQKQTNGSLDARIESGVHRAMTRRRRDLGVDPTDKDA